MEIIGEREACEILRNIKDRLCSYYLHSIVLDYANRRENQSLLTNTIWSSGDTGVERLRLDVALLAHMPFFLDLSRHRTILSHDRTVSLIRAEEIAPYFRRVEIGQEFLSRMKDETVRYILFQALRESLSVMPLEDQVDCRLFLEAVAFQVVENPFRQDLRLSCEFKRAVLYGEIPRWVLEF